MEQEEMLQFKSDMFELKQDVSDLKGNVSSIRADILEMKHTVSNAMEKIGTSSERLAIVVEKLNHNVEEHKILHRRIDDTNETTENLGQKIVQIETTQKTCLQAQKIKEETEAKLNELSNNSPFKKAKEKAIEYIMLIFLILLGFTVYKNIEPFLNFMNNQSNSNPVTKIP